MHTRVKICGITSDDDVLLAVDAGAHALGFNMFPGSARFVEPLQARHLVEQVPPFVATVGLFVNASGQQVLDICHEIPFDFLQFNGDESDDFCRQFKKPYLKAIRVKPGLDVEAEISQYPSCAGIILDAYVADEFGGTGKTIDWRDLPKFKQRIVLAGGLNPNNIIQAIASVKPYAVDVSSGVERSKGVKDPKKIREFMAAVSAADESG